MVHFSILFCAILAPFVQTSQLHNCMSEDEVQDVFQTTHDNVPEYEVVHVNHILHKRSANGMTFQTKINGMDRKLYLKPVKGFFAGRKTRVMTTKRNPINPAKLDYYLIENAMDKVATFYQDEKTMSSISHMLDDDGNSEFHGIIASEYVLRPVPKNVRRRRDLSRQNLSSSETDDNGVTKIDHIVYKRSPNSHFDSDFLNSDSIPIVEENDVDYEEKSILAKSELGKPFIIYPEIMVYLDDVLFSRFKQDVTKAVHYILTFWNAVDLRFRALKKPRVLLNIAGIVLVQDELPFVDSVIVPGRSRKSVDHEGIVHAFGKFLYNEDIIKVKKDYDVAVLMTGLDMYNQAKKSDNTLGMSFEAGACRVSDYDKLVWASAVLEDNTGYKEILTASHELAHLLGAPHDGETELTYFGGPGTKKCFWNDGYIMSYRRINKNKLHFSPCSHKTMAFYTNRKDAECLRNDPSKNREDKPMPKMLPGKYMSLDEQCKKLGYLKIYKPDANVCVEMTCLWGRYDNGSHTISTFKHTQNPAAEGSPCGDNMYCLDGECIMETESVPEEPPQKFPETTKRTLSKQNVPKARPNLPAAFLTGKNMSPDEKCKRYGAIGIAGDQTVASTCRIACKFIKPSTRYPVIKEIPADDGLPCFNGHCKSGKCVEARG